MELPVTKPEPIDHARATEWIRWLQIWPLYVMVLVFMIGNYRLPEVFWLAQRFFLLQMIAMVFAGTLASEVALLATWLALGPCRLVNRISITMPLAISVACTYIAGLRRMDASMPAFVAIILVGIGVGGLVLAAIPLFFFRHKFMWKISNGKTGVNNTEGSTFGIGYLMLLTAIVAVLLVLFRAAFPQFGIRRSLVPPEIFTLIAILFHWFVLTFVAHTSCLWLAFCTRGRWKALAWALIVLVVVTPLHLSVLDLYPVVHYNSKLALLTYSYLCGFMASATTVLIIVRHLGFHLRKSTPIND